MDNIRGQQAKKGVPAEYPIVECPIFWHACFSFIASANELFFLNIGHGAITVYAYLFYCEDRRIHQCHPSYRTISTAVHLTLSTVLKYITKLVDKHLIAVETISYINIHCMKRNGNNLYTILPIKMAMDHCYQQQMLRLEEQQKRLGWKAGNAPCAPL